MAQEKTPQEENFKIYWQAMGLVRYAPEGSSAATPSKKSIDNFLAFLKATKENSFILDIVNCPEILGVQSRNLALMATERKNATQELVEGIVSIFPDLRKTAAAKTSFINHVLLRGAPQFSKDLAYIGYLHEKKGCKFDGESIFRTSDANILGYILKKQPELVNAKLGGHNPILCYTMAMSEVYYNTTKLDLITVLLNSGADVRATNDDGKTAWDLASDKIKKEFPQLNPSTPSHALAQASVLNSINEPSRAL